MTWLVAKPWTPICEDFVFSKDKTSINISEIILESQLKKQNKSFHNALQITQVQIWECCHILHVGISASAPTPSKKPLISFHGANCQWGCGWLLPHPAQHKKPASSCPLAGTFSAQEAVFIESTNTTSTHRVCLTGSRRCCRFRTVQHCWGHTVTGGRWRDRFSLLWWTPPETAYLWKRI